MNYRNHVAVIDTSLEGWYEAESGEEFPTTIEPGTYSIVDMQEPDRSVGIFSGAVWVTREGDGGRVYGFDPDDYWDEVEGPLGWELVRKDNLTTR